MISMLDWKRKFILRGKKSDTIFIPEVWQFDEAFEAWRELYVAGILKPQYLETCYANRGPEFDFGYKWATGLLDV